MDRDHVMDRAQEPSGDYGYDLAHEETGRGQARGAMTGQEQVSTSPPGRTVDLDQDLSQDLSYDEAHGF